MNRKKLFLGITTAVAASYSAAQEGRQPNVLIIMADQLRADLVQREGYPLNTMPFTDSLAQTGIWFSRAYTAAPASGPARAAMLTGRFPSSVRVRSNHAIHDAFFDKDMFDIARQQGYKTALIGKNHSYITSQKTDHWSIFDHLGQQSANKSEQAAAFDKFLASTDFYAHFSPSPFGVEAQLPYRMTDDAIKWIGSLKEQPFMMWFSIPEPHNPYQTCEPYFSMFPPQALPPMRSSDADRPAKGEEYELLAEMMEMGHKGYGKHLQQLRSVYHGMLRMIDDQIKRLTGELKRLGVYDNTIIVFISDHGDYVGEYGLMKKGVGLDEVLVRIPMQWSGPGVKASAAPHSAHVSIMDIFPTICEIMGASIPAGVQGRSLWPMLRGENYPAAEFESVMVEDGYGGMYYTKADGDDYVAEGAVGKNGLFFDELNTWSQSGTMHMLRRNQWKLTYDMNGNGGLYNLKKDPAELQNLFNNKKYAKTKNELIELLLRWEVSTRDPLPVPRKRYRFRQNDHNYIFRE